MPEVSVNPIDDGGCVMKSLTSIGTSPVLVAYGSASLDGRRGVYLKNTSSVVLYWGFSSTSAEVCAPLSAETTAGKGDGGEIWIDVGPHQTVYIKAASGSSNTASIAELK